MVRVLLKDGPPNMVIEDVKWNESMVKYGEMKITRVEGSAATFLQGLEPKFGLEI